MKHRSTNSYPKDWAEIALRMKAAAGWILSTCSILIIKFYVTFAAKGYQIGKRIGFFVSLISEVAKGDDVGNRKFFLIRGLDFSAMLTGIVISVSGVISLLSPIGSIIRIFATLPMWTISPRK